MSPLYFWKNADYETVVQQLGNVDKMLLIIDLNFTQHSHKTFLCQLQFRLSTDNGC